MSVLRAYRRLLANRALARLLAGEFISSIGDWLYLVALLIVVYRESNDPVLLGIVGAARVLPYVVLSVPAGIAADRLDRRLVLLVTDVARGVIMLGLAWLVWIGGPLWAIVLLATIATCFSSFFGPTIGAFLPSLVTDEAELGPANSAWSSLDNLAFVIGPAVGGLLIAASSLTLAFLLNAASFAIVALVLLRLPKASDVSTASTAGPARAEAPDTMTLATSGDDPKSGAGAEPTASPEMGRAPSTAGPEMFRLRPMVGLAIVDVVGGFVFGGLGILTVVLATTSYGTGDDATGYLNAAVGVGGVIGAVGAGALVLRPRLGPPLVLGALALGLGLGVLGAVGNLAVALVAMTMAATGDLVLEVVSTTLFQRVVPDAVRGRAIGSVATLTTLAYAAGSLAMPILADGIGLPLTLAGGGVAVVLATVAGLALVGDAAIREDDAATAALRDVARLPIFAGVPPARLESAVRSLTRIPVAAGTVLIRQGEPADRFYIIESGEFEVTQREPLLDDRPRVLREMSRGEVFGEIGLLAGAARTATVTAATPGVVLALDGPAFLELVSSGPGLANRLLDLHRGASAVHAVARPAASLSET